MKKMQKEPSGVSILIGCIFIFMNILLYIREKSLGFEYGLLYALGYNFWIICGAFLIVHYQIKSRKFRIFFKDKNKLFCQILLKFSKQQIT